MNSSRNLKKRKAMTINTETKTITATNFELPMVHNYLENVVSVTDRKNWTVNITKNNVVEFRKKKE